MNTLKKILNKFRFIYQLNATTPRYQLIILLQFISGAASVMGLPLLLPVLNYLNQEPPSAQSQSFIEPVERLLAYFGVEANFHSLLLLATLLILIGQCLVFVSALLAANAQVELSKKYKEDIFTAYGQANWLWLLNSRAGEMNYSVLNEADQAGVAHLNSQRVFIYMVQVAVLLAVTLKLSVPITLMALGLFGIMTVLSIMNSSYVMKLSNRYVGKVKALANDLHGFQLNKKFFKTSLLNERSIKNIFQHIDDIAANTKRQNYLIEMQRMLTLIATLTFLIVLMYFHVQLALDYATLLLILLIFSRIAPQFTQLTTAYVSLDRNIPMYLSIRNRLKEFSEHREKNGTVKYIEGSSIRFTDVDFTYPDGTKVFDKLNATIEPQQATAFVGSSGVGKSTLLDLLLRLIDPQSGTVAYGSIAHHDLDKVSLRNHVAYVAQETTLVSGSLRENLLIRTPDVSEERLKEVINKVGLSETVLEMSDGLETHVGENGIKLSGGQKQRVALARALLTDPKILILDEATSSLDAKSESLIQETISQLKRDYTIVLVTHKLSGVRFADKIYVLEEGKVCESGTYEELLEHKGLFHALSSLQR